MFRSIHALLLGLPVLLPVTGVAQTCKPCLTTNFDLTLGGWYSNGITQVAIQGNAGSVHRSICSVELFTRSRATGPVTVSVSIYDGNGPQNNGRRLGVGTMTVAAQARVYRATLATPATVAARSRFYIVLGQTTQIVWPVSATGTPVVHFRFLQNAWTRVSRLPWAYRISCGGASYVNYGSPCAGSAGLPRISAAGLPMIGQAFAVNLSNAPAQSVATLLVGGSDNRWGSMRLPFALGALAPGCTIYASGEAVLLAPVDRSGKASVRLAIPNDPSLISQSFYNQFFPLDPSRNPLGITASDAGKATIG